MTDLPVPVLPVPGDFIASDDKRLFAFIDSLRTSVKDKVTAGQQRGLSLAEIVVEVREMVRFAEEDPDLPSPFPPHAYKAISRKAVAWCIEAYQPLVFTGGDQVNADSGGIEARPVLKVAGSDRDLIAATPIAPLPIN